MVKWFEIRDRATFIPVLAVRVIGDNFLARRAGFSPDYPLIQLIYLSASKTEWDPYAWGSRTLTVAHGYIEEHWDELEDGAVIDVEFILGETQEPKKSEREG